MTPGEYKYGDQVNYSDLDLVRFQIYVNDIAPASDLLSVDAAFSRFGSVTLDLPCTVIDAANAIFNIDEVPANIFRIDCGVHDLTVTATFANGSVDTYISAPNSVNVIQNPQ
jgi:hypothetical protein